MQQVSTASTSEGRTGSQRTAGSDQRFYDFAETTSCRVKIRSTCKVGLQCTRKSTRSKLTGPYWRTVWNWALFWGGGKSSWHIMRFIQTSWNQVSHGCNTVNMQQSHSMSLPDTSSAINGNDGSSPYVLTQLTFEHQINLPHPQSYSRRYSPKASKSSIKNIEFSGFIIPAVPSFMFGIVRF